MAGTKRKRSGDSWFLEVCCGTDFTGKPRRFSRTVHCKSAREADKELARFYAECESGKVNKQDTTKISDFAEYWFTEYAQRHQKRSTQNGTRSAIDTWIIPNLGKRKISKLSRIDVQSWINAMSDDGLSPKTIRNYYSVLRSIMDYAVDMGLIGDTPCRNVRLPKKEQHEAEYYNADQVNDLLSALGSLDDDQQKFKAVVLIILFGGLRKAEVLGLNWDDVDFDNNTLHIHRNRLIDRGGVVYEDTPKSDPSRRYVTIPSEVMVELRRLKIQQSERKLMIGPKYKDSPAVFQGETGGELHPQVLQKWFVRFLKENNLPHLGLHGLRHTHTSMLAYINIDKMQISRRLGHSQLSTTLNIYTHLFEDTDKQIADELSGKYLAAK